MSLFGDRCDRPTHAALLAAVGVVFACASIGASTAAAQQPTVLTSSAVAARGPAPTGSASRSIGVPDRGRLRRGVPLNTGDHLYIRTSRRSANHGTAELVSMIERAAAHVHGAQGGARLVVGDLSRESGGHLSPHRSHRSGRDADVGFFLTGADGESVEPPHFITLRRNGCGTLREVRYCFDAPRNWAFVARMVQDPAASVQYLMVAPDIRARLIAEGERQGADAALIERVRTATEPHRGSASHRSHFHVRIYCPLDDRPQCNDEPPFHDWYEGTASPPAGTVRRLRVRQRAAHRRQQARARRQAAARQRRARARRRAAARRRANGERAR